VIYEATCTFAFAGTKGNSAVVDSSTVTLTAAATLLQGQSSFVLRDGDSAQDNYGNTVKTQSSRTMQSG
jgi:hypothetical protein